MTLVFDYVGEWRGSLGGRREGGCFRSVVIVPKVC